ncbi:MAG: HAMP domain-containing sensor histidine kinase [Sulfurimonas sp.]|uniref:sensor histidine kinase n=1 Tax=Sulfurimonas sp. TaxID=2022749 RepID=UPI0026210936|nr:HAMP domain-containing sensor histidine kinase [Sulfurimonas sp.]MDD5401010.1 HAMP domain-containing sensor histidine kinase [Sulfurimonas sp.]
MNKISLRKKYTFALILVAVYALLFHTTTITLVRNHDKYAQDINLVAKEQMITAKIIYCINYMSHHVSNGHKESLKEAIEEFERTELILKGKGYIFEEESKKEYLESVKQFLNISDDKRNDKIEEIDVFLQKKYDVLIKNIGNYALVIQKESEESTQNIVFIKTLLLILLLLLLAFEAFFIFLPTENEIKAKTKELEDINKDLQERVMDEVYKNREKTLQIIQQSKLAQMGEMLNMIAHQWRQPLASISAISGTLSLDIMMDNYKADFFQAKLDSIDELANYLSRTIDDFRNFFKNDKKLEHGELKDIVEKSFKIIAPCIETKNITISTDIDDDIFVYTYITEIKQVLLNIIKNAEDVLLEKNIANATIWVKGRKDEKYAELTIEDNGGGISDEVMSKIFEPYFSTKKDKEGTGIGLYMSKMIIEEHCKGKIDVQNGSNGAKFTINIPLDKSNNKKEFD